MVIVSCGALASRSLETSASSGSVRSLASILGDHALSSSRSASCKRVLELARAMRPPTVMSCDGCRNRLAPSTLASCGRSRAMICEAVELALLARLQADEEAAGVRGCRRRLPKNEPNAATSGSAQDHLAELALQPLHLLRRDILRGLGEGR